MTTVIGSWRDRVLESGVAALLAALAKSPDGLDRGGVDAALSGLGPDDRGWVLGEAERRGLVLRCRRTHGLGQEAADCWAWFVAGKA